MSFYSIFAILIKDLIDVTQSKTVWISLAIPIILSLFFNMAFSYSDRLPSIGIYDPGHSGFIDFIKNRKIFTVKVLKSEKEARERITKKECFAIVLLPEHFDKELSEKGRPSVNMLISESINESMLLFTGLLEVMRIYSKQSFPMNVKIEEIYRNSSKESRHIYSEGDFNMRIENLYRKSSCPLKEILPLWVLLTIMGGLVITTTSLIEERDKKTLNALLVSPVSIYEFVIGKGLLGVLLTFVSSLILMGLNGGLTGNIPNILFILLMGGVFFSIWGIFVAFISPSQSTANSINSLVFILLLVPLILSESSNFLWTLSRCLPSYYFADGISKSMESNCFFGDLYVNYLVLLGGIIVLFGICLNIINRQES